MTSLESCLEKRNEPLGPPKPKNGTCRHGYGPPIFDACGTLCVYCGRPLKTPYESWLSISVDHIIPKSTMKNKDWDKEGESWIVDQFNMVTCCRSCNEFLNGYRVHEKQPRNYKAFVTLRDKIYQEKCKLAIDRHKKERELYEKWLKRINNPPKS